MRALCDGRKRAGIGLMTQKMPAARAALARRPEDTHVSAHRHNHDDHDHEHDHFHRHTHDHESPPLSETALISARRLSYRRNSRDILVDVDVDLSADEIVTLIGPNGAGKTTLVRILLGLESPDRGEVVRKDGLVLGYVPQRFDLDRAIPLTVNRFLGLGRDTSEDANEDVLNEVGAGRIGEHQVSQLSGGELQRVLLARALLREPAALVLDEPVRGVDFIGEADLYRLIGRLRTKRGLGILLVSHDLHIVMSQSDRVVCLNRHVCCSGRPHSVAQDPEYARLFGPQAAHAFALYQHSHDHTHDITGDTVHGMHAGSGTDEA
jgi:zinc transport system ATP-binding protein